VERVGQLRPQLITFNGHRFDLLVDVLAHGSATLTLERWCADHRLADPAQIVAERVHNVDKVANAEVRSALDRGKPEISGGFGA
jgi:hypothetical protein